MDVKKCGIYAVKRGVLGDEGKDRESFLSRMSDKTAKCSISDRCGRSIGNIFERI